jgi:hypothetical protein
VGVIGNKLSVEGQAYGGLSHSIGFALSEDYNAENKHGNIAGCGIPTIDMIPDDFNIIYQETPRKNGPHGSAGCSENFQCSGHMAVINAIANACGARVYDLRRRPTRSRPPLKKSQRGEDLTPPNTSLGLPSRKSWSSSKPIPYKRRCLSRQGAPRRFRTSCGTPFDFHAGGMGRYQRVRRQTRAKPARLPRNAANRRSF